ncbi:hypothetical protein BDB01DRAFT_793797 [Pilobolus umbonatus]|nr:hypothetical protein BDB01DRAFT_793797 [Pilobolus umbonatus]
MPPYLFSRKPLLFILFVSVFLFLFHIASYPTVTESIQPVAYYNGYDEQVCLPKEHLKHHPPKQKAKAALVILVRNK